MINANSDSPGLTWLAFAFLTVFSWGVYGVFLHSGQTLMKPPGAVDVDPSLWRYKAFLFVGVAYFLVAVLAPLAILLAKGAAFSGYTGRGMGWSLVAGIVGAIGAFGVLLAFGAKGKPPEVMAIVFAGAPVVNALVSIWLVRHEIDWGKVNPLFYIGMILALVGGGLVTLHKPNPTPRPKQAAVQTAPDSPSPSPAKQ